MGSQSVVSGWSKLELHLELAAFDLAPWGVAKGARIAVVLPNGPRAAIALLSAMGSYCAVPLAPDSPAEKIASVLANAHVDCVLACDMEPYASRVRDAAVAADHAHDASTSTPVILLRGGPTPNGALSLPPSPKPTRRAALFDCSSEVAPKRSSTRATDTVLVLHTSGTSSRPKMVPFSLARLLAGGRALAESMRLTSADVGLNAMPLHHVGGIVCNLVATLVSGGSMDFQVVFDASA